MNKDIVSLGSLINLIESYENKENSRVLHLAKRSFLHREITLDNSILSKDKSKQVKMEEILNKINSLRLEGETSYDILNPLFRELVKLIDLEK